MRGYYEVEKKKAKSTKAVAKTKKTEFRPRAITKRNSPVGSTVKCVDNSDNAACYLGYDKKYLVKGWAWQDEDVYVSLQSGLWRPERFVTTPKTTKKAVRK